MALVYRHRRSDNFTIFYIGIELDSNNKKKLGRRPYIKQGKSNWWTKIVKKTDYTVEIIANNISNKEAIELEILLIREYGRRDLNLGLLVNHTNGGEGIVGFKHSLKTKLKQSKSAKGRILSEEHKLKISKSHLGKKLSKETVLKMLESRKGYKHSKETLEKLSISCKGFSETARKNALIKVCKKVIDTETGIIYDSVKEASLNSKYSITTIRRFLNGKYINKTNLKYYDGTRIK